RTQLWPIPVTRFPGLPNTLQYEYVTVELQPYNSNPIKEHFKLMVQTDQQENQCYIPSYATNEMVYDTLGEQLSCWPAFYSDTYEELTNDVLDKDNYVPTAVISIIL